MNFNPDARSGFHGSHRRRSGNGRSSDGAGYSQFDPGWGPGARGSSRGQPNSQAALLNLVVSGVAAVVRQFQSSGRGQPGDTARPEPQEPRANPPAAGLRREPSQRLQFPRNTDMLVVAGVVIAGFAFLDFALRFVVWGAVVYTGVIEPLYATLGSLESFDRDRERRWLMYWSIFGIGMGVDLAVGSLGVVSLRRTSAYPAILLFVLTWLRKNDATNAENFFEGYLRPAALRNAPIIQRIHSECSRATSSVARAIVDTTRNHLEPYVQREESPSPPAQSPDAVQSPTAQNRPTAWSPVPDGDRDIPGVVVEEIE